ncbi:MAG: DUF488 domain-containing protein [Bacillota bacterium]
MLLHRQQSLLLMITLSPGQKVSGVQLTRWAFLLSEVTPSGGGRSFYDFLPHKNGPFSFLLRYEVNRLADRQLIDATQDMMWEPVENWNESKMTLPKQIALDVARVVENFHTDDSAERAVHQHYPWHSSCGQRPGNEAIEPRIFTIGYEKKNIDQVLRHLYGAGVKTLVDVRANPVSRKYGFHKSTLSRLCGQLNTAYEHYPQLGIPRKLRHTRDTDDLLRTYRSDILARQGDSLRKLATDASEDPIALLCMEADPDQCHRSILAQVLREMTGLPIKHLGA